MAKKKNLTFEQAETKTKESFEAYENIIAHAAFCLGGYRALSLALGKSVSYVANQVNDKKFSGIRRIAEMIHEKGLDR